jgi:hypothetical protein
MSHLVIVVIIIFILVYIFERYPSGEANNHLAGEGSTFFYGIRMFITIFTRDRCTLRANAVDVLMPYLWCVHFNISLQYTHVSQVVSFSQISSEGKKTINL